MNRPIGEGSKNMDCSQFEGLVHDLGRRAALRASLRDEALTHAESCARCAALLEEVELLDSALRSMAAEQVRERAPERVKVALVTEFHSATGSTRRSVRWQIAAVAAAAVVLLSTGWALRHFAPAINGTSPRSGESGAAIGLNSAPGAETEQAYAVVAENEGGVNFIRLPEAADGAAVEDDAIVRAVLPRSALASLGFPVGDSIGAEPVPVELMVNEDGTPEAIRLVSQDAQE